MFGRVGAAIGFLAGIGIVGGSYWFSDRLAIRAARAVPVTEPEMPDYYRIVRELCAQADIAMPRLCVTPDAQPNAFATGRNPSHAAVAATAGLFEVLDPDEPHGVLAHELSHVSNRDIPIGSVAAAIATAICLIANLAMWGAALGGSDDDDAAVNPLALLAAAILASLAAGVLQMALSRSRQFDADRSGADLIHDGEPLARALVKLDHASRLMPMAVRPEQAQVYAVYPLTGRKIRFAKLFSSHPTTEAPVACLRAQSLGLSAAATVAP